MAEAPKNSGSRPSAFAGRGMAKTVAALSEEIRELYLCDAIPWVVGYSGGKDSSAVLQLVWNAIRDLPPETAAEAHPRHHDRHARRATARGGVGRQFPGEDAGGGGRAGPADHPAQAHPGDRGFLLGESDRQGLPGPAQQVPLVHRAAENPPVQQVHPRRRAPERARPSSSWARARPRASGGR